MRNIASLSFPRFLYLDLNFGSGADFCDHMSPVLYPLLSVRSSFSAGDMSSLLSESRVCGALSKCVMTCHTPYYFSRLQFLVFFSFLNRLQTLSVTDVSCLSVSIQVLLHCLFPYLSIPFCRFLSVIVMLRDLFI
jgi:hypothetical protein